MHSETLLSLFLPVLPTLLRSYPTGQAERKAARKMQPDLEDVLSTRLAHLLDRHSVNAAAQLANAQSECKEVPTVRQNARRHLSHLNVKKYLLYYT